METVIDIAFRWVSIVEFCLTISLFVFIKKIRGEHYFSVEKINYYSLILENKVKGIIRFLGLECSCTDELKGLIPTYYSNRKLFDKEIVHYTNEVIDAIIYSLPKTKFTVNQIMSVKNYLQETKFFRNYPLKVIQFKIDWLIQFKFIDVNNDYITDLFTKVNTEYLLSLYEKKDIDVMIRDILEEIADKENR